MRVTRRTVLGLGLLAAAAVGGFFLASAATTLPASPVDGAERALVPPSEGPVLEGSPTSRSRPPAVDESYIPPDPPAGGPFEPDEIPSDDRIDVTLLHALTEEPLTGVRLGFAPSPYRVVPAFETDAQGRVTLPLSRLDELRVLGAEWRLLPRAKREVETDRRLYGAPLRHVHITVAAAPGAVRTLDPTTVTVAVEIDGLRIPGARPDGSPEARQRGRRASELIFEFSVRGAPDLSGRVTLVSLRGPELLVRAHAAGWESESVELRPDESTHPADVRLTLAPLPLLSLRVQDATGAPIPGARVGVTTKVPFADDERPLRGREVRDRFSPYAAGVVARPGGGGARVFRMTLVTDAEGRARLDLHREQDFTLLTQAPGMLTDVRTLHSAVDHSEEIVLLDAARSGPRLPVLQLGRPIRPGRLHRCDVTDPEMPLECPLEVDAEGTVPAREFREGRSYHLLLADALVLKVRWDGRATLDLDTLESVLPPPGERPRR